MFADETAPTHPQLADAYRPGTNEYHIMATAAEAQYLPNERNALQHVAVGGLADCTDPAGGSA